MYGPFQSLKSQYACVVPKFITCILKEEPPPIYGDGKQSRDFVFVEDVVEANILSFLNSQADGQIFNVATGRAYSVLELLDILKEISNKKIKPLFCKPRPGDVFYTRASLKKAKKILGFIPKVSFKRGLKITFDWFRKNTWFWKIQF